MCRTSDRLRKAALDLSVAEGNLPQLTCSQDFFLDARAALRLLQAARGLTQEYAPILDAIIKAMQAHPSDLDAIASAYGEAEIAADDLSRYYSSLAADRAEEIAPIAYADLPEYWRQ